MQFKQFAAFEKGRLMKNWFSSNNEKKSNTEKKPESEVVKDDSELDLEQLSTVSGGVGQGSQSKNRGVGSAP
jgi:hypothetical protein